LGFVFPNAPRRAARKRLSDSFFEKSFATFFSFRMERPMSDNNKPSAGRVDVYENVQSETLLRIQQSLRGDHPYLQLIGRVASEWTHFEHILDQIIWALAGIDENIAICITGQMIGATLRFKAIDALGKHLGISQELLTKTNRLKNDNYAVVEGRNRIVHDPWFVVMEPTGDRNYTSTTGQLKSSPPGHVSKTQQEIWDVLLNIRSLITKVSELQVEFMQEIYSLRHISG